MEELKINRKILGECCRKVLFDATMKSKTIRENTSFVEQTNICKEVVKMSDIEAISMIFNEGIMLDEDSIKGLENSKIKTGLKYGLAAAAGGLVGGGRAAIKSIPKAYKGLKKVGKLKVNKKLPKSLWKAGKSGAKGTAGIAGSAITMAALSVLALYLYRTATDPCARECLKKFAGSSSKVTVCKRECEVKAIKKILAQIKSQKSQCKQTANPAKCEKKLNNQLIKWSKKLQSHIIKLSKAKEKMMS